MPEGHTLRRLANQITAVFGGREVRVGSPQGRFAAGAALLDCTRLTGGDAWGKHLFLSFDHEQLVHVHLGLYGTFDVHDQGDQPVPVPVGQVRLRIATGSVGGGDSAYADLRGPTACALVTMAERDVLLARIGPDPLRAEADPARAWRRIQRSSAPIGTLLMDQSVLAGVGNVYRAEVLFRQRIHPLRPGRTLRVSQWQAIWDDLVVLMSQGVVTGRIDTVRPEHMPEAMQRPARIDDHGGEVYVYRRGAMPCHVCGRPVRSEVLAGRNLFWCSRCQPVFRSRAGVGRPG
ncbi:MAG: Fpg/Nei family DNA glycosylase [Nocardioidaceae bacterium]|nr:Fpg/Nei family DNA glycosylase [Nocardioidaceae bacterium]